MMMDNTLVGKSGSSPKYKEIESFNPILQKKKKFLRSSRMIGITWKYCERFKNKDFRIVGG